MAFELFGVFHLYDVDGGFGDAVTQKDLLCVFLNKEEADKFAKQYENEHVYGTAPLYCGKMVVEELPTTFNPEKAWWEEECLKD